MTRRPCTTCGRTCVSPAGVCNDCRRSANWSTPDPSDALRGGRWVGRGGIMRWVETPPEPPTPPVQRSVSGLLACPTCHAHVDQTCRTTGGNVTAPHASRLAPRLCPCGETLAPKRRLCDPCAEQSRRETFRLREVRQPTATRRRTGVAA